jgi:hypothetical protein
MGLPHDLDRIDRADIVAQSAARAQLEIDDMWLFFLPGDGAGGALAEA